MLLPYFIPPSILIFFDYKNKYPYLKVNWAGMKVLKSVFAGILSAPDGCR